MNRSIKAFTLVEIMIVVVIIGLLATLSLPAILKARANSQRNAIVNNLRQINSAAQQYMFENGVVQAALTELVGTETTKYIKTLNPIAGEIYTGLIVSSTQTQLTITSASAGMVVYTP
jgi:prepilin-type N-terminal cleavage/methylation domain-containing protein